MPHIIVEYSENLSNVNVPVLLAELHDALAEIETINKAAIKTRAIPLADCVVGEAEDYDEMMHITLKLLPGRPVELKREMAGALYGVACGAVSAEYTRCSVSVEVMELDAETYTK